MHPVLKINAKKLLTTQLEYEIDDFKAKKYSKDNLEFRQHLLLLRTIHISLVYQGEASISEQYLQFILSNAEWDDLNRGFHMEYYGDNKLDSSKLGLHNDDLNVNILNTYTRLSKRIREALADSSISNYLMFDIELQTITSLAVNRFLKGNLDENIKTDIVNLLEDVLSNHSGLYKNDKLKAFVSLSHYIISKEKKSISSILEDIYLIKTTKRSGWNYKGKKGNNFVEVERVVKNPESVADHSYGTLIIAFLFLPNECEFSNYSKNVIKDMLLIHDLAESFTGDIISFIKGEDDNIKEDAQMKSLLSLSIINGFGDFSEFMFLWDDFVTKGSINARIAYDIDKIETYLQLQIYHKDSQNIISDFETWKSSTKNNLLTKIGIDIFNKLTMP